MHSYLGTEAQHTVAIDFFFLIRPFELLQTLRLRTFLLKTIHFILLWMFNNFHFHRYFKVLVVAVDLHAHSKMEEKVEVISLTGH